MFVVALLVFVMLLIGEEGYWPCWAKQSSRTMSTLEKLRPTPWLGVASKLLLASSFSTTQSIYSIANPGSSRLLRGRHDIEPWILLDFG